jgi:hypothetical protein
MSPYLSYQMVQAEQAAQRARYGSAQHAATQRQADAQLGELAAAVAQCFRGLVRPAAAIRAARRHRLAREMP